MDTTDFVLFSFYSVLLFFLSYKKRQYWNLYLLAFIIKIIGSLIACYINYYLTSQISDSIQLYFTEGTKLYNLILDDISNIKYLFLPVDRIDVRIFNSLQDDLLIHSTNFMVIRIVAIFSFFCLGKYFTLGLFFSFFALTGLWKLYIFFCKLLPQYSRYFFLSILVTPNIVIWSSSVLKDPLCMGCLGWITYLSHELFVENKKYLPNIILLIFFTFIIYSIKPYIILSYLPAFVYFLVSTKLSGNISPFKKKVSILSLLIVISFFAFLFGGSFGEYAITNLLESMRDQQMNIANTLGGSNFSLGIELDGSIGSLLKSLPIALFTTFFRPFIWESHNLVMLLTAIESSFILLFCTYVIIRVGFLNFIYTLINNQIVLYCFIFALFLGLFVGTTTLNFGALVRYKMPCVPFFINGFIIILKERSKKTRTKPSI